MSGSKRMPRLPKEAESLLDRWPAPEKGALEWETMAAATMERIRSGQSAPVGMDVLAAPLPPEPHEEQLEVAPLRDLTTSLEALELSQSVHAELREGHEATARSVAPHARTHHERFRGILWAGAIAAAAAGLALYVVVRSHAGSATPASSADLGLSPLPSSPVVEPATRVEVVVPSSGQADGLDFHVSGPIQKNERLVLEAQPSAVSPVPAPVPGKPSPGKLQAAVPSAPDAGVQAGPGRAPGTPGGVDRTDSLDHIPAP